MKKIMMAVSLLLSLCMALAVTGCGGNNSDDPNTLTIAVQTDNVEQDIIKTFIRAYKQQPGNEEKEISIVRITGNYDTWINNQLYVDKMADIIQIFDYSSEFWTSYGLLAPISEYMERDGLQESDYFESVIEMAKSGTDGQMYWVPRDYNKVVVAYNTEMFRIAGIDTSTLSDDWTFEDFRRICEQLKAAETQIKEEYSHLSSFWPADMNLNWAAVYYPVIKSYGGELIDKENAKAFGNLDAVKQGFNLLLDFADSGLAVDPTEQGAPFANKQCAMMFISRPNVPDYYKALDGKIDFLSFPSISGVEKSYIGMGCTGYGMTTSCPDSKKEFAWDFLKFIMSEAGQEAFCASGSGIPMLISLAEDPDASYRTVYEGLNHDAFIQYEGRDLAMNYMKGFRPEKQLGIYSYIKNNLLSSFFKAKGDEREAYYTTFANSLEEKF